MLDICIFEKDPEELERIRRLCFIYLMDKNYEADIYELSGEIRENCALYLLMFCDNTERLARQIRAVNSQSYIAVTVSSLSELSRAVCPGISPSGFILKPPDKDDVRTLLDEIYTDHCRCTGDGRQGVFRFKTRSREYTIPYDKILLFESRNKKVVVRTEVQEFDYYDTLDSVMQSLPEGFMKIHRSFVVNTDRIASVDYSEMTVFFDDGSGALLSRTYKNELKQRLNERSEKSCNGCVIYIGQGRVHYIVRTDKWSGCQCSCGIF